MKTVSDYVKLLEDAMPTNTASSGAIATREVPLGSKIAKRKDEEVKESGEDNPLAKNAGKFALVGDEVPTNQDTPNPVGDNVGKPALTGVEAPDVDTDDKDDGHMFRQKQATQQNYSI